MTRRGKGSLRVRLTYQLVVLQAIAICIVAASGLYALMSHFGMEGRVIGPENADIIIHAVQRLPDGRLSITETSELAALRAEAPNLWYVVADEYGRKIEFGTIPSAFVPMAAELHRFGSGSIPAFDGDLATLLRLADTDTGRIHILLGGGRTQSLWQATISIAVRALVPIVLTLALVAVVVIAWIIRREFRGAEHAAKLAATIDAGGHGTRLPEVGLPAEILPLVQAVNKALGRLDEGYARQRRFLADAAHELKTPIAILTTRLETSPPGADRDRRLLLDVARLGNLAEQLLDTQRLDHSPTSFADVDLVALAKSVAADLAPLAIDAGYELDFDAAVPAHVVRGDRAALERVIVNLVQNAIAHGGGKGTIAVEIDVDGMLAVSDEGEGIAEGDRERVFQPFYRIRPSERGSGLGLSIVQDIVTRHGGRIVVGDHGSGSVFRVAIPKKS